MHCHFSTYDRPRTLTTETRNNPDSVLGANAMINIEIGREELTIVLYDPNDARQIIEAFEEAERFLIEQRELEGQEAQTDA